MAKTEAVDRRAELAANVWQSGTRPWLLGSAGAIVLLLYFFALFVRQMPGQLQNDPTGAARWLLRTSEAYGVWGEPLRMLGLFNVLHNPLLQLLLIVIAFVLLLQLGSAVATGWRLYQLKRAWSQGTTETAIEPDSPRHAAGTPQALPAVETIFRWRSALGKEPVAVSAGVVSLLTARFDQHYTRPVHVSTIQAGTEDEADGTDEAVLVSEEQHLLVRHVTVALLRPVLHIGLFLALATIWLSLIWGWDISLPPLAPGAEYRSTAHGLLLSYTLSTPIEAGGEEGNPARNDEAASRAVAPENTQPRLLVQLQNQEASTTMGTRLGLNWGQTTIVNRAGPPALLLRTLTDTAMLSRLGQTQMVPSMGLVFPSPGSEEAVVINQAVGLRIVRSAGNEPIQPEQFLVEIYDVNANESINRMSIQQATTIDLAVGDLPLTLAFVPLPSLLVSVNHQPAIWLLWLALLLIGVGLVGYLYKPAFLLLQVAPWPVDRTVVIVQSDVETEVTQARQQLQAFNSQ